MTALLATLLAFVQSGPVSALGEKVSLAAREAPGALASIPAAPASDPAQPTCFLDQCAPIVTIPGREPVWDMRGRRTALFLALLDRLHVEPVSDAAWFVASTGVRLDYRPVERQIQVFVRWPLGAYSEPMFLSRPSRR
jgi:hypothetical protein